MKGGRDFSCDEFFGYFLHFWAIFEAARYSNTEQHKSQKVNKQIHPVAVYRSGFFVALLRKLKSLLIAH